MSIRRIGIGVLAILIAVAAIVAGGLIYLTSRAGNEKLLAIALQTARDNIQGTLEAQRLEFTGGRLALHGVILRDPEGEVVARIDSLELHASLLSLLRYTVDLSELQIVRPELFLKSDEKGLNLTRAVASKKPLVDKPDEESKPSRFEFALRRLDLTGGSVDFLESSEGLDRTLRLEDLSAHGSAQYGGREERLETDLALQGRLTRPTQGPVSLELHATGRADQRKGDVSLILAGLQLQAQGQIAGPEITAKLGALQLTPETARAFLPSYPLLLPIAATGEGAKQGDAAAAKLDLRAGRAQVVAEGTFDLVKLRTDGFTVRARSLDLEQLIENGPKSDIELDAHAEGGGRNLASLEGTLEVVAPVFHVRSQPVGPIRMKAAAHRGSFQISELVAVLPGLKITGSGGGDERQVSFLAKMTASDLSAFSRTLGGLVRRPPLRISGSGELNANVKGPTKHPGVRVGGAFPSLRYDDYGAQNLTLTAAVADVRKPLESQLALSAATIHRGVRVFRKVTFDVTTRGRDLTADLKAHGFADLALQATATVDSDNKGLQLSTFSLEYPEAQWSLQRPARMRFAAGDLSTEELSLRAGAQGIRVRGFLRGKRMSAEAEVEKLDLHLLPKALVDPSLNLAGALSARMRANGRLPHPTIEAHVDLRGGQFKTYSNLGFALNTLYEKDRATGTFDARAMGTRLQAEYDVPVEALRLHKRERVHLVASIEPTKIEDVIRAAGRADPFTGTASAKLELIGMADDPRLTLTFQGQSIRRGSSPPADVRLSAQTDESGKLSSRIELAIAQSKSSVAVRTPLTLGGLLKVAPTRESLMAAPLEVDADVHDLPLALVRDAGLMDKDVRGKLSMTASIRGTPADPTGRVVVSLAGAALPGAPPLDASLVADATPGGIQASVNAQRENRRLLDATASIRTAISHVREMETLSGTPLNIKLTLGPISIDEMRRFSGSLPEPGAPQLSGVVHADMAIAGTLRDPRVSFRSQIDQLAADKVGLGQAKVDYAYAASRSELRADVSSAGGNLSVDGTAQMDLSYASVKSGLDPASAPLNLSLRADKFDLALFAGLSEQVRALAGKLQASATVNGTIGAPHVNGRVEWTDGRIALLGYGQYEKIHLLVEGTDERVQLKELLARSGGGQLKLTAEASRNGANFMLNGKADLNKFPVISDDQVVATVSLRGTLEGEVTPRLINVRRLHIPEAHVELPEDKPKNLQKMQIPEDIVLLRNGKPTKKSKHQAALASAQGTGGGGDPDAQPQPSSVRQIAVNVDAPRNIWIKGNDVNVEVGLADGFHVDVAQKTVAFGDVNLQRGRVDVLGRRFDIQKDSSIRFGGPLLTPYVNVTVLHTNDKEQPAIKVYVTVQGQGKDLVIKTSSEPPLTDTEIYTLLATGRRTLRHNSGATTTGSSEAVSIVGSLAASELKKTIASALPLDVLSIEAGDNGLQGAKLEAGTYVTDQVYIGYAGRIGARPERGENANAVKIDYQITPRWSLEGEYGSAKAGSADLIWSRDY